MGLTRLAINNKCTASLDLNQVNRIRQKSTRLSYNKGIKFILHQHVVALSIQAFNTFRQIIVSNSSRLKEGKIVNRNITTWYSTVDLNQYNRNSQKGNLTLHKDAINLTSMEYLLKHDSALPMRRLLGIV